MANYVSNTLIIQCNDMDIMRKIKGLIFVKDENGGLQYSMQKLSPMPLAYSGQPGYLQYGNDWYCKRWVTKWDTYGSRVIDSGLTLTLFYETKWGSNNVWVKTFCKDINRIVDKHENAESITIQVEHDYWELMIGLGGKLIWRLGEKITYHESGLMEYAFHFDRPFHDDLVARFGYEPFIPKAQSKNLIKNNTIDKTEQK